MQRPGWRVHSGWCAADLRRALPRFERGTMLWSAVYWGGVSGSSTIQDAGTRGLTQCTTLVYTSACPMKRHEAMQQLSVRLFGAPLVAFGGEWVPLRFQKELALLIYLAVTNRPHTRLALATLFWPEHEQARALASLRRVLYQIKADVGEGILDTKGSAIGLSTALDLQVDTRVFLTATQLCREHSHPPQAPFASCIEAPKRQSGSMSTIFWPAFRSLTALSSTTGSFLSERDCELPHPGAALRARARQIRLSRQVIREPVMNQLIVR